MLEGEGEPLASIFADNRRLRRLINDSRGFAVSGANTFLPGAYPDPWLSGHLDPSGGSSVHVETIRGCPGSCIYCSYRRTHPMPRVLDAAGAAVLLGKLVDAGAGELVFIDPTFNTRNDLKPLLRKMKPMKASFFAEVRGDLITPEIAGLMAQAGFESVETGLQTINRNTLAHTGRPVDPDAVLRGGRLLKREGISPVMDIILGLPGDTPEDSLRTAQAVADSGLQDELQVFYLSWLPGTVLRKYAEADHMERPPYWGTETAGSNEWRETREKIADIAGYDLHLNHRPLLFDGWPGTETVHLNKETPVQRDMPSFRHGALRLHADDMWRNRNLIELLVRTRYEADPFCVLDVILVPSAHFPLDIIDMIWEIEASGESDYTQRTAALLEKQGKLRVSILLRDFHTFAEDWIRSAAECCTVAMDATAPEDIPRELLQKGAMVRLAGTHWKMADLSSRVPSLHSVLFSQRSMEEAWTEAVGL
ncbi:MAG: radical SAM protein [Candidatus Aegiribacteria sp.]|nr:radical SAM protein [Candidatus Aegiribacteria sp.]MBD3294827.1 radical SAM protein [Candidatus Fermentibacteria bacterium]